MRKKRAAKPVVHIPLGRAGWEAFANLRDIERVERAARALGERVKRMPTRSDVYDIRVLARSVKTASEHMSRADHLFSDVSASTRKANDAYAMARNLIERLDSLEAKLCQA